jgi:CRP/FNR family transcriptional regulator, cyclic AMP receptor protein
MSIEDQRGIERPALKWPRPALARRQPEPEPLYTYVLDADSDLAEEFDLRSRVAARQLATARVLHAPVGECILGPWFDAVGEGPGLLILDGVVAFQTRVGDRTALELVGSGDLLQLPSHRADDLLERGDGWRVLLATRFALLDAAFADRVRPWPQIVQELLRRAGRRTADVDALRAITCQPRLEVRLVLLLWHLAARWGRVEPTGIKLTLPLTHRLLGQLVAAERPSISHALGRLADAGVISGTAGDWHLHGSLDGHLETLIGGTTGLETARRSRRSTNGRIA